MTHKIKKLSFIIVLLIIPLFLSACTEQRQKKQEKTAFLLDTIVTITIYEGGSEDILDGAIALIESFEDRFSKTRQGSEIARLNNEKNTEVSPDTAEMIGIARTYAEKTDGAFDISIGAVDKLWDFQAENPTLPNTALIEEALKKVGYKNIRRDGTSITLENGAELDLGGIAKGYIADKVKTYLQENGVTSAVINLGGDVLLIGQKGGEPFAVGVADPQNPDALACILDMSDCAVVTTGIYERSFTIDGRRYHHILDPKTGWPIDANLSSVTIVTAAAVDGDALATACLVLGEEKALALLATLPGTSVLFIDREGNILPSSTVIYR